MDKVVHFEIPADNVERAQGFYMKAFGWEMNSMPDMGYTMIRTVPVDDKQMPTEAGAINGGMAKREAPLDKPVIVISVKDIEASLRTIESLGGSTIRKKMPVGDMGFAAYFKDSEGNVVGLWQDA